MTVIKGLLLAIFIVLLSICANVVYMGYEMPNFVHLISAFLPIGAIIVVICSFFLGD